MDLFFVMSKLCDASGTNVQSQCQSCATRIAQGFFNLSLVILYRRKAV